MIPLHIHTDIISIPYSHPNPRQLALKHTPRSPHAHGRAQEDLPPIDARAAQTPQRAQQARPIRLDGPRHRGGMAGADRRQVEGETDAGEVGEGAAEVVEALGLGEDGGDGDGALEGEGEADGRDQG